MHIYQTAVWHNKSWLQESLRWGHGDLNAGHRTPSPVGYQATLWPRAAHGRMQRWHISISHPLMPHIRSCRFDKGIWLIYIKWVGWREYDLKHWASSIIHRELFNIDIGGRPLRKLVFPDPFRHDHPPVRELAEIDPGPSTYGEKFADWVYKNLGSWKFILIQSILVALWIILNASAYMHP